MKSIATFVLFFFSITILSQENYYKSIPKTLLTNSYIINTSFKTNTITDFYGDTIKNTLKNTVIHKIGYKIKIIRTLKLDSINYVIFQYWAFKKNNTLNIKYFLDNSTLKYFILKKDDFKKVTTPYFSRYKGARAGIYTIPFKLRFSDFNFEKDLNLGVSIGLQYRLSKMLDQRWILEPSFGIGLTKINLTSNNTNNSINKNRSATAFTASVGLILRFSEKINAGLFFGKDYLGLSDKDTNWIYNGETWVGLGINIGFSISKEKKIKE